MSENHPSFFEVGDGYRASELYPVGSQWKVLENFPTLPAGTIVTVEEVHDGTARADQLDDTRIKTSGGNFTATEAMSFFAEPSEDDLEFHALVPQSFTVRDLSSAEWVLRKITEEREHRQRFEAWYQQEKERSQKREQRLLDRFADDLERFARQMLEGGKTKSLSLPSGVLSFRMTGGTLSVTEPDALKAWARQYQPEAIKLNLAASAQGKEPSVLQDIVELLQERGLQPEVSETLVKDPINRYFKLHGEVPGGCEYIAPHDEFSIKPPKSSEKNKDKANR